MWGVFRHIPCSRICYALFDSEKEAQNCCNDFCRDNPDKDYYVIHVGDNLKNLAKYIVFGVKP